MTSMGEAGKAERWAMFLRGVNVGGHRKLPMAELRVMMAEQCGAANVATYIASGNAVFDAAGDQAGLSESIAQAIHKAFGFKTEVLLQYADELRAVVSSCPFPEAAGNQVIGYLCFAPPVIDQARVDALIDPTEALEVRGNTVWIQAPNGIGRSKLAEKLDLGVTNTARNLNTLRKMAEML
ncbi:MAG: DUF1697 domain-containing protein [Pseudomonadota bacterium]